jgi:hypothetical protein
MYENLKPIDMMDEKKKDTQVDAIKRMPQYSEVVRNAELGLHADPNDPKDPKDQEEYNSAQMELQNIEEAQRQAA